jgi:uncharacterized protein YbbK (DUF523 family)
MKLLSSTHSLRRCVHLRLSIIFCILSSGGPSCGSLHLYVTSASFSAFVDVNSLDAFIALRLVKNKQLGSDTHKCTPQK